MSTLSSQPEPTLHPSPQEKPAGSETAAGRSDGERGDAPEPIYAFWDTLAWGLHSIFDRGKTETKHDPNPNLKLESFLFYLLVAILFCIEVYIWFNGFDSILRNYLLRQYNIEPKIQVRAIIIAVLVIVVVINSLKLLSLVMVPFSMASSFILSLLGLGNKKKESEKKLKDEAIDFLTKAGSSLLAWGAISIEILISGLLIGTLKKDNASSAQICNESSLLQSLACLKSELLAYQLPGVSLVVLILTILFASAFAIVEISLFRADFGNEFEKDLSGPPKKESGADGNDPSSSPKGGSGGYGKRWTNLLLACIVAGLLPPILYAWSLDGLKRVVILVYASVLLLVVAWSYVRFGIKGAIGYYLRVYSIVASVLITGFSLDVIFYDEPVDHLFKLNESVDIKRRMQVKLAQLGNIPPSPTQPPAKLSSDYIKGSLWRKLEKCIAKPAQTDQSLNKVKQQEVTGRSAPKERADLEELASQARKEKTERARKKGIAFSIFQPEEWDAVRCYNEYFTDRKEYNAASAHLFANSVLEHRDLYSGITFDTQEKIAPNMRDWFHLVQGVPANHPRNEGGRSLPIAMSAYRFLDRDNHCKSFRAATINCLNEQEFLELAILHDYLTEALPKEEVTTTQQTGAQQTNADDLEWGWIAPDCRDVSKMPTNDGQLHVAAKDKSQVPERKAEGLGEQPSHSSYGADEISHEELLRLLRKNDLCIVRHPSLVERNRYKELYVSISKYEKLPIKVGGGKLQDIRKEKEKLDKEVFEKTEVLATLLASLIQILVILSKLIISSDLYNRIRSKGM